MRKPNKNLILLKRINNPNYLACGTWIEEKRDNIEVYSNTFCLIGDVDKELEARISNVSTR